VINEDPSVRVINDLRIEVEKLKLALEVASSHNFNSSNGAGAAGSLTVPRRAFFPEEVADDDVADVEVECTEHASVVEPSKVSKHHECLRYSHSYQPLLPACCMLHS
jgi:hypothetical protein